jgi:hypothetical protein
MTTPSVDLSWLEAFEDFIKSVGIPATALFWVLWRTDRRIDRLTERVDKIVEKL